MECVGSHVRSSNFYDISWGFGGCWRIADTCFCTCIVKSWHIGLILTPHRYLHYITSHIPYIPYIPYIPHPLHTTSLTSLTSHIPYISYIPHPLHPTSLTSHIPYIPSTLIEHKTWYYCFNKITQADSKISTNVFFFTVHLLLLIVCWMLVGSLNLNSFFFYIYMPRSNTTHCFQFKSIARRVLV